MTKIAGSGSRIHAKMDPEHWHKLSFVTNPAKTAAYMTENKNIKVSASVVSGTDPDPRNRSRT